MKDIFKIIETPSKEILFKDKNSKFYGYAFPIHNETDVKMYLAKLKKEHHTARHWCYAYQINNNNSIIYRANDDGEPNNSAGMPIYGQIQSFNVTNILIVVARYFGGVKLGVPGLINAYKTAAKLALESSTIVEKTINMQFKLVFDYKNMNKVMRTIKEMQLQIISQTMELKCEFIISTRISNSDVVLNRFKNIFGISVSKI